MTDETTNTEQNRIAADCQHERVVIRCPACGSANVGHLRFDSDWAYGGDWTKVNADCYYSEHEIRKFDANERPDIDCNICGQCGQCF